MDPWNRILIWFGALLFGCVGLSSLIAPPNNLEPSRVARENLRNLSGASVIEIRDARRTIMRGEFQPVATSNGGTLKAAHLSDGAWGVGKAEIELTRHSNGLLVQELEVDVNGLGRDSVLSVFVDGREAGTFRTDAYGGAELERYGRVADVSARVGD